MADDDVRHAAAQGTQVGIGIFTLSALWVFMPSLFVLQDHLRGGKGSP